MKFNTGNVKLYTRLLSFLLSFIVLFNLSIPVFAVSDNSNNRNKFYNDTKYILDYANISYTLSDLQTIFDMYYDFVGNTIKNSYDFVRGFLDFLYDHHYIIKSPVTGFPVLNLGTGVSVENIIDNDDFLDTCRRPREHSTTHHISPSNLSNNFEVKVRSWNDVDVLSLYYNSAECISFIPSYAAYELEGIWGIYPKFPALNSKLYSLNLSSGYIVNNGDGFDLYYDTDSDIIFMNLDSIDNPVTYWGGNNYLFTTFCHAAKASGRWTLHENARFWSRDDQIYNVDRIGQGFDYWSIYWDTGLWDYKEVNKNLPDEVTDPVDSYPPCISNAHNGYGGIVFGDCMLHFATKNYLYHNGQLYDLGYLDDPYNFDFDDGDFMTIAQILALLSTGGSASGNGGKDYTLDLKNILAYLRSIDNRLALIDDHLVYFSDNFELQIENLYDLLDLKLTQIINKIGTGSGGSVDIDIDLDTTISQVLNRTYNYYFIMTDEQKLDIDADLARIRSPFNWIFAFFDGVTGFVDDLETASAAYSSGSGIGTHSSTYLKASSGKTSFSAYSSSVNMVSGNYVSLASAPSSSGFVDIEDPDPEVVGSGAAPVFKIHFGDSTSKYNYGGDVNILDFSWYDPYKPYVDKVIVIFAWAVFMWHLFKTIPSIISGGDGLVYTADPVQRTENQRVNDMWARYGTNRRR